MINKEFSTIDLASEQLYDLCKDRKLQTSEIFEPNDYYGMASIIKQYANINQNYPLKFIIPHGIVFNENHIWQYEINFPLPSIAVYPHYRFNTYKNNCNKYLFNFSSPFLYLIRMKNKNINIESRQGLIFFPAHSTHRIEVEMDYQNLALILDKLEDKYKPITICIYWKDYLLGHHIPFIKKGFKVVSAGHIYDPLFLHRLYSLLSTHKYAASNQIGSSLFYSIAAGCCFFLIDYGNIKYIGDNNTLIIDHPSISNELETEIVKEFTIKRDEVSQKQNELMKYFLGFDYLLSPKEMKYKILQTEILDKIFVGRAKNRKFHLLAPPWIYRLYHR